MSFFSYIYHNLIKANLQGGYESEPVRKIVVINLFALTGIFFMVYFGIRDFLEHRYAYALNIMVFAILTLLVFIILRKTKNYKVAGFLLVFMMFVYDLFFLFTGGQEKTGLLWFYVFPALSLFTQGLKRGTIYVGVLLLTTAFFFYLMPEMIPTYSVNFRARFLSSFVAVTFLSMAYEYVRKMTYESYIESDQRKTYYLEETRSQKEELAAQSELLKSTLKELERYRDQLEDIVKERTKELESAKEKAEESDRLKSAFLANLSHEIRTPLNAIIGFTNLIITANIDDTTKQQMFKLISHNSDDLIHLIEDLIDLSMIESGQLKINKRPVDLNNVMNQLYQITVEKFAVESIAKLKFILELPDEPVLLETDEFRVKQVLSQLLSNAFKFTETGNIRLGYEILQKPKPEIFIYVKDTGIGLSESQQNKIFRKFEKMALNGKKLYRGTGMGLTICKSVTELLGGEIGFKPNPEGGSIFFLSFPHS